MIFKEKANTHTYPLLIIAGILPFKKIILQAKLNFMHSVEYNCAPPPPIEPLPKEPHQKY
jgi:hypothetical protein